MSVKQLNAGTWKNPRITEGREVALSMLKPGEAELERGFELHAQATVVESYGFSAFMPTDPAKVQPIIDAHGDPEEVAVADLDSRMTRMAEEPAWGEMFREAWEASGVTCVLRNSGEEGNHPLRMLERVAYNTYVADWMPELMMRATRPEDIVEAKRLGKRCFYLTTNGVPLPMEFHNTAAEMRLIRWYFQLGVRMMHLTYNRRNPIGDGCAEPNDGGLSDFGREVVREMNRVGMIVDGAHSSLRTCLDAAACSDKPVVISHATCRALHEHCRGKTDEVIKAVADTGGYIGICCIPRFLGGRGDITTFLDHIDHAVRLVGADHVTIGTDKSVPMPDTGTIERPKRRQRFEAFWPPGSQDDAGQWTKPEQIKSMHWTNYPLFTVGMVQRGYSDEDIMKILGGNVLRVARAVLE